MKKILLILSLLFFCLVFGFAQTQAIWQEAYMKEQSTVIFLQKDFSQKMQPFTSKTVVFSELAKTQGSCIIPSFNADNLPFFCKIEHHLDQKSNLNFRFRLGSKEVVDLMEGK